MTYEDIIEKVSKTINNSIVLSDYKSVNLNWIHAIRTIIFNYESDNFLSGITENEIITKASINSKKNANIAKYLKIPLYLFAFIQSFFLLLKLRIYAKKCKADGAKIFNLSFDTYDVNYGGFWFNPYSDNVNLKGKTINLCIPLRNNTSQLKATYFKPFILEKRFIQHLVFFMDRKNLQVDFLNKLQSVLDESAFINLQGKIKEVYDNYKFFLYLLNLFKPEQIFLYDSYNTITLGLIAAGKQLNILTIEQQHGIIADNHPGYCYNYSDKSQTDFICHQLHYYTDILIDKVRTGWTFYPELVDIEHSPAFQLWQKFNILMPNPDVSKLKSKINGRKVVSFGLTNLLLPDWLIDSILKNKKDNFYCFRLHPRYYEGNFSQINELSKRVSNCDFELCSSMPLFDLMEISDFYLSDGSTSLIDALMFDIKCICYSEIFSRTVFDPYVRQNLIDCVTNENELNKILEVK